VFGVAYEIKQENKQVNHNNSKAREIVTKSGEMSTKIAGRCFRAGRKKALCLRKR
jgi:hypothetical protein